MCKKTWVNLSGDQCCFSSDVDDAILSGSIMFTMNKTESRCVIQ